MTTITQQSISMLDDYDKSNPSELVGPDTGVYTLPCIFVADGSLSMKGAKIAAVNDAFRNMIYPLQQLQADNDDLEILVQIISFDEVGHRMFPKPISVGDLEYKELTVGSWSKWGEGLKLLVEDLSSIKRPLYKQPVLTTLSDGAVTHFDQPLADLLSHPLGKKARRIAFAVGEDADYRTLERFISSDQDGVCKISSAKDICDMMVLKTINAATESSRPRSINNRLDGNDMPSVNKRLFPNDALEEDNLTDPDVDGLIY